MSRKLKISVAAVTIIGLAVVLAVYMWGSGRNEDSLRAALSRAFNRSESLIEINLPPADGRYPGAVLVSPQVGQILPLRRAGRPEQLPGSVGPCV